MMKILLIIILLLSILSLSSCKKKELLGAVTTFSINDNLSDGKGEKVRVILLYGQSNATGCSSIKYLQEKDNETYASANNGIDNVYINYCCENGSNSSNNEFKICALGCGASSEHFGPEVGIGLTYQEKGLKCYIIKYSWGGSVLDYQWMNGKYKRGELYEAAINFTKTSLDYLISKNYDIQIDAICWMQGESDSNFNLSDRYYKNTKEFVRFLRHDLSSYQKEIDFIDAGISDSPYWTMYKKINNAKIKFSNEDDHNYYFDTIDAGLHYDQEPIDGPDIAHFDSESEILLGKLFGNIAINKEGSKL